MKSLIFVNIELETSVIHQNKAEFMQKFTSWQKNMLFFRESWLFKGGWNFTPPRALVYKKYVGPRRVNTYRHRKYCTYIRICQRVYVLSRKNLSKWYARVWYLIKIKPPPQSLQIEGLPIQPDSRKANTPEASVPHKKEVTLILCIPSICKPGRLRIEMEYYVNGVVCE